MTCTQVTSLSHPIPSTRATRGTSLLRRWWRAYWNWRAREATILILRTLDERTLRDIGVNRAEIASFVYGERGERRRIYDETWRR